MRRLVMGDIHGEYDYLMDVLKKSKFDYENDLLIQIGDICDRGVDPFKCMDELLKIKNLILIKGNHDANFMEYYRSNKNFLGGYTSNGTHTTIGRWNSLNSEEKESYKSNIFNRMVPYHLSSDNIIFTHGGLPLMEKLDDISDEEFAWDREMIQEAMKDRSKDTNSLYDFKKIFIGHTPTIYWDELTPIKAGRIINVDTGSGKGGPLTIMDIDTEEYWQSYFK